jgi:hypothetical protein
VHETIDTPSRYAGLPGHLPGVAVERVTLMNIIDDAMARPLLDALAVSHHRVSVEVMTRSCFRSAGDIDHLARDITTSLIDEEGHHVRDVVWYACAPGRDIGDVLGS